MSAQQRERIIYLLSPLALVALWELLVQLRLLDLRFFPAPSQIAGTLTRSLLSGELLRHTAWTIARLLAGFAMGAIPGLILGTLMGLSGILRAIISPWVAITYPIPKTAIMPLIMLIFGLGDLSKIVVVATGVWYLILLNTMAGVMNIERIYYDVGQNFGANRLQTFWLIAIPGAMPVIMSGVRLGMGFALLVIVVAEFVGTNETGIGYMIWNAWQTFDVRVMYVALIAISALGFLFTLVLDELERHLLPWKPRS